jgi:hypothetical protein
LTISASNSSVEVFLTNDPQFPTQICGDFAEDAVCSFQIPVGSSVAVESRSPGQTWPVPDWSASSDVNCEFSAGDDVPTLDCSTTLPITKAESLTVSWPVAPQ